MKRKVIQAVTLSSLFFNFFSSFISNLNIFIYPPAKLQAPYQVHRAANKTAAMPFLFCYEASSPVEEKDFKW